MTYRSYVMQMKQVHQRETLSDVALGRGDMDAQAHLFTVRTGTVSGKPARNMAMRASLARWLEGPSTLPTTMSPTACSMAATNSLKCCSP
jgi:hypothetical protein